MRQPGRRGRRSCQEPENCRCDRRSVIPVIRPSLGMQSVFWFAVRHSRLEFAVSQTGTVHDSPLMLQAVVRPGPAAAAASASAGPGRNRWCSRFIGSLAIGNGRLHRCGRGRTDGPLRPSAGRLPCRWRRINSAVPQGETPPCPNNAIASMDHPCNNTSRRVDNSPSGASGVAPTVRFPIDHGH